MTMVVEMLIARDGEPDIRGDRAHYPAGGIFELDDAAAGYFIAMGFARPRRPLPDEGAADIRALQEIVAAFRAQRVEPTFADLYRAVFRLAAEQPAGGAV